jgi:alkyl sulfatase BDS1-like metallo-beta-lactamase superfamily hydrolase
VSVADVASPFFYLPPQATPEPTTGEEITVDGVKMVLQMTPDTEAPAEMNTFFPHFKAM